MGEIAEMMLEGILCQYCGEYLDVEEGCGFPMSCGCCEYEERGKKTEKKSKIPAAERKIRKNALAIIRKEFDFDMQGKCGGATHWEFFLHTRFMDYIREARNSKNFKKVVIKSVKEWAEINELSTRQQNNKEVN